MKLKSLIYKIRRLLFLLKEKGFKYTYNYIHLYAFYGTLNPFLAKFLYWLEPYPSYIEVEVTTRCNLKCRMCEHTYWNEANRDMTFEEFKNIIDQFPGLKWIGPSGLGESFLNKDFMKMLRYVKSKNIFVELYDNFYFIDEKRAKELIEMGVDHILTSFDAATKETYEKIRVGSNFERVVENMRNFVQIRKKMKKYFPELTFHFIINKLNMRELPKYIKLVSSVVQGESAVVQFTRMAREFKGTSDLFVEVPDKIIRSADRKAKELSVRLIWNNNIPLCKPPINQCTLWLMPFIFVTGHVIPCCSGNQAGRRDFQKATAMGNVFEQSFKDIWTGEKYKNLRRMLKQGKVPAVCEGCPGYESKKS